MTSGHDNWQELSPAESRWQDLKRIRGFVFPIVVLAFCIMIYTLFGYVAIHIESWIPETLNQYSYYAILLQYFSVILFPGIAIIVGLRYIFKRAGEFVFSVYQPGVDEKLPPLIRLKLLGVPPFPPPLNTIMKYPSIVIKDPALAENHWARWFGGPATLIIYDGVALYLERSNNFSRIVGPGVPMQLLERHERIKEIVDLRPQTKDGLVEPWTKDGIRIKLTLSAEVQIDANPEALAKSSKLRYPFDPLAVRTVVERMAVKMTPDGKLQEQPWLDGAWGTVTGAVNAFVAGHSLDELFLAPQAENHTNSNYQKIFSTEIIEQILSRRISEQVFNRIQTNLNNNGIKVLDLQITHIDIPEKVRELRTKYWETIKRKISAQRDSRAEADHIRAREQAHADAQRTMLMTITKKLENIASENLTESLVLSLSGILDQGLDDPIVRPLIAKESFAVLERMRKLLNEKF